MEYSTNTKNRWDVPQKDASPTENKFCTGSEAVMISLLSENVEVIFGYPGGAIIPVYDALYDYSGKLKHILVRHEQAATHAAEGYARTTGKTGVVLATSGPGATNLVTGLADALMDSVPMVCIVGQVNDHLLGTDAFQEANIISVTRPVTKWNCRITDAHEIAPALAKAFFIARNGKPGPVLVEITKNAQMQKLDSPLEYYPQRSLPFFENQQKFGELQLNDAARFLNNAKKPMILAGNGVGISSAENELLMLAELLDAPVACTLHGLSFFPSQHPLFVGMLGMHGNYAPNKLTNQADVILAIGMRFDDRVTGNVKKYAPNAVIIHIEIDPSEIGKIIKTHVALRGDAKQVICALIPLLQKKQNKQWKKQFRELYDKEYQTVIKKELSPEGPSIKMAEVMHLLTSLTNGNAIAVADVGQHQMIAARYYKTGKEGKFFTSGGLGTMGFSLPAAMGAVLGKPGKTVVAVMGDGCFQMNIQELATIVQYQLPVKILILNNHYLGMVRQWQELFHEKRYSFVEMVNPDFSAIGNAYGIPSSVITERSKLTNALSHMLKHAGPYLLNVMVEKCTNVFPMIPAGKAVDEIRLQ